MEGNVTDDILKLCELLNKHGVEYLIIGGTATAFYGYFRGTRTSDNLPSSKQDFDFWYNPVYENYFNLLSALEELGIEVSKFRQEQFTDPRNSFFSHEFESFKIDFLPQVIGLSTFGNSFSSKVCVTVRGIEMYFISKADLVKSKAASLREKDIDDLNQLQSISPDKE